MSTTSWLLITAFFALLGIGSHLYARHLDRKLEQLRERRREVRDE